MNKWGRPAAVVAICIVAALYAVGSSAVFRDCLKNRKDAYAPMRTAPSAVVRMMSRLDLDRACAGEFTDKDQGPINALATVLIALFTLALWRATGGLWVSTEKLVVGAESTADRQLRAYLGVDTLSPFKEITGGVNIADKISVTLFLKNYGQTPAHDVIDWINIIVRPYPGNDDWPEPLAAGAKDRGTSIINPGQAMTLVGERSPSLTQTERQDLNARTKAIYIYGRIDFKDASGAARWVTYRYFTQQSNGFCQNLQITPEGNAAN